MAMFLPSPGSLYRIPYYASQVFAGIDLLALVLTLEAVQKLQDDVKFIVHDCCSIIMADFYIYIVIL